MKTLEDINKKNYFEWDNVGSSIDWIFFNFTIYYSLCFALVMSYLHCNASSSFWLFTITGIVNFAIILSMYLNVKKTIKGAY